MHEKRLDEGETTFYLELGNIERKILLKSYEAVSASNMGILRDKKIENLISPPPPPVRSVQLSLTSSALSRSSLGFLQVILVLYSSL